MDHLIEIKSNNKIGHPNKTKRKIQILTINKTPQTISNKDVHPWKFKHKKRLLFTLLKKWSCKINFQADKIKLKSVNQTTCHLFLMSVLLLTLINLNLNKMEKITQDFLNQRRTPLAWLYKTAKQIKQHKITQTEESSVKVQDQLD